MSICSLYLIFIQLMSNLDSINIINQTINLEKAMQSGIKNR